MLHSTGNGVCAAPEGTIGIHSCWVSVLSSCSSQQNRKMLWKKKPKLFVETDHILHPPHLNSPGAGDVPHPQFGMNPKEKKPKLLRAEHRMCPKKLQKCPLWDLDVQQSLVGCWGRVCNPRSFSWVSCVSTHPHVSHPISGPLFVLDARWV